METKLEALIPDRQTIRHAIRVLRDASTALDNANYWMEQSGGYERGLLLKAREQRDVAITIIQSLAKEVESWR